DWVSAPGGTKISDSAPSSGSAMMAVIQGIASDRAGTRGGLPVQGRASRAAMRARGCDHGMTRGSGSTTTRAVGKVPAHNAGSCRPAAVFRLPSMDDRGQDDPDQGEPEDDHEGVGPKEAALGLLEPPGRLAHAGHG